MVGEVRSRMIEGAVRLLATRGLDGTSFSEVLELTGAPRGSVYHHFPEGKEQLIGSAVERAGGRALDLLDTWTGLTAEEVATNFLGIWREILSRSRFEAGCAVLAVTVATDSPSLLDSAATVFRAWRARLAALLQQGGLRSADAARFAALLVASSEGAVVICRAEHDMATFDLVSESLLDQVRGLIPS